MTAQATFDKKEFNPNYDHTTTIVEMMNKMGYTNVRVETCLTNGLSHYVRLNVEILNPGKLFYGMDTYEGRVSITIRISNHWSNLELHCGGVSGNKMTMHAFQTLIEKGGIQKYN